MIFYNEKNGGPWGRNKGQGDNQGTGPDKPNSWGQNPKSGNGIDDAIDMLQRRFKKGGSGGGSGGGNFPDMTLSPKVFIFGGLLVLALWASTGFFRVQEGDLGVILRFGEMKRIVLPGLQYRFPFPIETHTVQKFSEVNVIGGGMRNQANDSAEQTLILTGDENMVYTNYTVLWKIKDIKDFLFVARNPEATIKVAAESVIREIVGQTHAKAALTEGRDRIGQQAQELLQKLLDGYKLGTQVISVQLQSVAPPREVIESFNDVQSSLVDADREVNMAESYRNDLIPRARGQVTQDIQDAEAYRASQIARAEGEASRFNLIYEAYVKNPDIVQKRYYLETMGPVLSAASTIILDAKNSQSILPYLPINEFKKQKTETQPTGGANH